MLKSILNFLPFILKRAATIATISITQASLTDYSAPWIPSIRTMIPFIHGNDSASYK